MTLCVWFIIIRSLSLVVMGAPPYSELGPLGKYAKRIRPTAEVPYAVGPDETAR